MGLMSVKNCPVCGSADRAAARDGMATGRRDMGLHYLKHAARQLSISVEQLADAAKVYQCINCDTYYCDPWLSPATAAYIFTAGAPDHIAGWGNFEHWLSSSHPNNAEAHNRKLYGIVQKKIGTVSSYAEFGCPFQGFLLMFRTQEVTPAQRIALFASAMRRDADVRWTLGTRLYQYATRWASYLLIAYHRLRALKEFHRGSAMPEVKLSSIGPSIRLLLTQDTTRAWGNNCVRYGASCRYYANTMLGVDALPFCDTVDAVQVNGRVDLLGIFNGLDHTQDPVQVIRDALRMARHVVIKTHHAEFSGKQHQYAFSEKFPQWLNNVLDKAVVQDITGEMIGNGRRDINYVLISNLEE